MEVQSTATLVQVVITSAVLAFGNYLIAIQFTRQPMHVAQKEIQDVPQSQHLHLSEN